MAQSAPDLRVSSAATDFYEDRFRQGYMAAWPEKKRRRVQILVRALKLPPTGRALDFGCGVGVFSEILAEALPGWTIEGTDLSVNAVEMAARRLPDITFFPLAECETIRSRYDLIFTHHVLEHVGDIHDTASLLQQMAAPGASMFHILPCGDPGSLAQRICALRVDGVDPEREGRFFFEEEGHLRRLTTRTLCELWREAGFTMRRAWYANHFVTTIEWITATSPADIIRFADPGAARDASARRRLLALRTGLLVLWGLRKPTVIVRQKTSSGCHSLRDYLLLAAAIVCLPLSWPIDLTVEWLTNREWARRQNEAGGAEMYVHLVRSESV